MSEVKLNLVDAQSILVGTIHGSIADSCVAALSAEPETIAELAEALARYHKPDEAAGPFACFISRSEIDPEPYDAGIVVIDLAARIVSFESSYSHPQPEGEVRYHDGTQATDISVLYRVPADWLFVNSVESCRWSHERRARQRTSQPPLDARAVLYGSPLLEFIVDSVAALSQTGILIPTRHSGTHASEIIRDPEPSALSALGEGPGKSLARVDYAPNAVGVATTGNYDREEDDVLAREITRIHALWLTTPREDLRARAPRDVLLEKQDFIDFDLHSRCLQWTFQGEGPPCLPRDSFAYRYAGFGTQEWVVYYDLVRHLLLSEIWSAPPCRRFGSDKKDQPGDPARIEESVPSAVADGYRFDRRHSVSTLEQIKTAWLEQPHPDYDGRVPAIVIDNERKRLPQVMSAAELMIDEDCECCRMLARDAEMGLGPTFWHLDGCNMDDEFAFSTCLTLEEWEAENRRRDEFNRRFELEWQEREQRLARGEVLDEAPQSDPF